MSERASTDSGPRSMAPVKVAPCLQRIPFVLARGFTVSPSTDNVSFEWQETWCPLSQEPPLAAAGSSGPVLCLVLED